MLKKLLLVFLLLPSLCFAGKYELGVGTGLFFGNRWGAKGMATGFAGKFALNTGNIQWGCGSELIIDRGDFNLSPHLFFNTRIKLSYGYIYAGGMAGYMMAYRSWGGPTFGVQSGIVADLSKHISFTGEYSVRFQQVIGRTTKNEYTGKEESNAYQYLMIIPITVGLRYKL